MTRDELLTKLAMELPKWPDNFQDTNKVKLPSGAQWIKHNLALRPVVWLSANEPIIGMSDWLERSARPEIAQEREHAQPRATFEISTPEYDEEFDRKLAAQNLRDAQLRDDVQVSKYHREIVSGVYVDVYDVLQAFGVTNPALQHLIKKALAPGKRGHKDLETDMNDIIDSAHRAKELALRNK